MDWNAAIGIYVGIIRWISSLSNSRAVLQVLYSIFGYWKSPNWRHVNAWTYFSFSILMFLNMFEQFHWCHNKIFDLEIMLSSCHRKMNFSRSLSRENLETVAIDIECNNFNGQIYWKWFHVLASNQIFKYL